VSPNPAGEKLTPREIEILKLIATGFSTKEIAGHLKISFKTAASHRYHIMAKLGVHEIANLTRYAIRHGYVDTGGSEQSSQMQTELFDRVRRTEARYRQAMDAYHAFLSERADIGLANSDSTTGARRLRQAEQMAHQEYHATLVALKDFLIRE
jgi:DNA-binding CsgD family transcriptional regulator